MTLKQWLRITLAEAPPEPIEFLFGLLLMSWGFWVMMPWWSAFDLAPTVYRLMIWAIPDEFAWGAISFLLGTTMLRALYEDARLTRYICSICLASLWGIFDVSFWASDWRSPAGFFFLWLALGAYWLQKRVKTRWLVEREQIARRSAVSPFASDPSKEAP